MDPVEYAASLNIADAQSGLANAYADAETPQQAAERYRKARMFSIDPSQVLGVTPEQEAAERVRAQNWAALNAAAPTLVSRLSEPAFANLVKEDLGNTAKMEELIWRLAPEKGQKNGVWGTLRNSTTRGLYGMLQTTPGFGTVTKANSLREELQNVEDVISRIKAGEDMSSRFVTAEDPTGAVGLAGFIADQERIKANLKQRIEELSEDTARLSRYASFFPAPDSVNAFYKAKGAGEAISAFLADPLVIGADVGGSSFTQNLPMLAGLALTGGLGLPVQMGTTLAASFGMDRGASLMQNLAEDLSVDMSNPEQIAQAFLDPSKRAALQKAIAKADRHAAGTALLDALSVGVASKTLVPKSLTRQVLDSAYKRNFANMAVQMPVQGAMGGAGEALGQYMSDGEITSWADIIAETVGEHFTAPVEILATGARSRVDAVQEAARSQQNADTLKNLAQLAQQSQMGQLDPETAKEFDRQVAKAAGVESVTIDAQSFHQAGFDTAFEEIPEVQAQMASALETGGELTIPLSTFVRDMLPKDKNGKLLEIVSIGGTDSVEESNKKLSAIDAAVLQQQKEAREKSDRAFRAEVAEVGRAIGADLRKLGITKEEARNIQAIVQVNVSATARDLGMSPKAYWEKYGSRYLGEPDIARTENGVTVNGEAVSEDAFGMPSPEWQGNFVSFLKEAKDDVRFVAELPGVHEPLRNFISKNWGIPARSVEIQITKDQRVHAEEHVENDETLWLDIANLPEEAEGAVRVGRKDRIALVKTQKNGKKLVAFFDVSHSEARARKGKGAEVRLGFVTAFETSAKGVADILRREEDAGRKRADATAEDGRRTPSVEPVIPTGYYTERERSVGRLTLSNRVAKNSFTQFDATQNKGEFFPTLRVIARWKNADRSTLLHETGHMFLDMRMRAAADLLSVETLTEDQKAFLEGVQDVCAWLKIESPQTWASMTTEAQTEAQEKFARSFEAYVMEGKAPTSKLQKAFDAFARWLKAIYSVLSGVPGAELNDDVRDLFDSLFLSQEEIRAATIRQNMTPLFNKAEEGGMSTEEYGRYKEDLSQTISMAEADLAARNLTLKRYVRRLRREAMKGFRADQKNQFAAVRKEVEAEFKETKTYKAWKLFRHGDTVDGKAVTPKILEKSLSDLGFNKLQFNKLKKARLATVQAYRQALPLEDYATALGYANAKEMVNDLLANPDADAAIDRLAWERIADETPWLKDETAMQEAADAAIFNDAKVKVLTTELNAMERAQGRQRRTEGAALEAIAYKVVEGMDVRRLRPIDYVRASNRAARRAREMWLKGAVDDAIIYQRQALFQAAIAKNVKEARTELTKGKAALKRFRKKEVKGLETPFLTVIQRALANFGFYTEAQLWLNEEGRGLNKDATFATELADLENETGWGLAIGNNLIAAITAHDPSILSTVGGFRQFLEAIATIEAAGRKEAKIRAFGEEKMLADVQQECSDSIARVADEHGRDPKRRIEEEGFKAKWRDVLERIGLNHARAAALFAVLDGAWDGVLTKLLVYTSDAVSNHEAKLKNEYALRLNGILKPLEKRLANHAAKRSATFNYAFTEQQAFVALLNYGNEGNRQRLLSTVEYLTGHVFFPESIRDNPEAMAYAERQADLTMAAFFNEYLTDEHYKAAEAVWALFDDIRKSTGGVAKAIMGREPVWVKPRPVAILSDRGRMLTGGYYPITYDRLASYQGSRIQAAGELKKMKPVFASSGVSDGHLKDRVKIFDKPIVLTSRAMFEGLDEQIHYIAWAQWVNDARKVLKPSGDIARAIVSRYGTRYFEALTAWVQDCRNGTAGQTKATDDLANILRQGVSLAGIGFNLTTAMVQVVGATQSVAYLGGKWAARGMSEFLRMGPQGSYEWIAQRSSLMQDRMRTQFREVAEVQGQVTGATSPLKERFMRAAYLPLTAMQMLVDLPTWLGAYEKALAEGSREVFAIAAADRAVLNSQGSGRVQDLSRYERGGAWEKLFTVFYTFFNTALNLSVVSGKTDKTMTAAGKLLMMLLLQPVIETFLRAGGAALLSGESDDDWLEKLMARTARDAASFNMGLIFGLRELSFVLGDYGYQGPTGLRKISDTGKMIQSWGRAIENGEIDERVLRHTVSGVGVWAGLPVTPINRAISGAAAIERGDTDNYLELLTGHPKE